MKKVVKNIIIILLSAGLLFAATSCSPKTFTLTYIAVEGGNIIGEEIQTIENGKDGTEVTAAPNTDYIFTHWSDGKTNPTRQDRNVQKDKGLIAFFAKIEDGVKLTVTYKSGEGGYIEEGETHLVLYGQDLTVTAVPNDGYEFTKWSDGRETAERTDESIKAGFTVTAIFAKLQAPIYIQVKYIAGTGGSINGETIQGQEILYGRDAHTVTAIADDGYEFVKWSDDLDTAERTDENITAGFTITAIFRCLFSGGNGTESNPFLIDSYEHLLKMAYCSENYFKLTCDLDLNGVSHKPIFDNGLMFNGGFDGNNCTISNMKVESNTAYPSLFGYVYLGKIKNLNITNFEIKMLTDFYSPHSQFYAGAVCGVSAGTLTNITANGVITVQYRQNKSYTVGGLIGYTANAITNCHTDVAITSNGSFSRVGGLVGWSDGIEINGSNDLINTDIVDCSSKGSISMISGTCGGLVGYVKYGSGNSPGGSINITRCQSEVNIFCESGESLYAGGLLGLLYIYGSINIIDCFAIGDVIIENGSNTAGGLIGYLDAAEGLITNCFAMGDVKTVYGGGFGGSLNAHSKTIDINNCYATGNVVVRSTGGGFCYMAGDVKLYRCYATGNVDGYLIAGFISSYYEPDEPDYILEECFSTGDLTGTRVTGFIPTPGCTIKNCYSKSNIFIRKGTSSSYCEANGFVGSLHSAINNGAILINCYYAGKITILDNNNADDLNLFISGIASFLGAQQQIINCHWLKSTDSLASIAVRDYYEGSVIDATPHSDISQMYYLADTLNINLDEAVWINISNDTPQLKHFVLNG